MTVFGLGYRTLEYAPTPWRVRVWAIARREAAALFRSRWGVMLFFLCLLPWLVRLMLMLVVLEVVQFEQLADFMARYQSIDHFANPRSQTFYLDGSIRGTPSILPLMVLTVLLGSRTVARDRGANALEILWTRGIGPGGYMLGKWLGTFLLLGSIFVLAPLVTWATGVLQTPDWEFFHQTAGKIGATLPALIWFTAVLAWLAVITSAVCTTANLASLTWLGVLLGSWVLASTMDAVLGGNTMWPALNPWVATARVAEQIAGEVSMYAFGPGVALASVVAWCGGLTLLALPRLKLEDSIG